MAWHRFGPADQGVTGDEPIDLTAAALDRIAEAYLDRFGRPPLLAELLHAIRVVLEARPDELLSDPETLAQHPPSAPLPAQAPLDLDAFEAAWSDLPAPDGGYLISERATGQDVLRCALHVDHRTLHVDYALSRPGLGVDDVARLILHTLIRRLVHDTFAGQVDRVAIAAVGASGGRATYAYP